MREEEWPPRDVLVRYYNELYDNRDEVERMAVRGREFTVPLGREFHRLVEAQHGTRALDIGCGTGELAAELLSKFSVVQGTEISEVALEVGRRRYPDVAFHRVDGMRLPFPGNHFDLITSDQVLEHIYPSETDLFFSEIARVLTPGGVAIIATPNGAELRRRILRWPVATLSKALNRHEGYVASFLYVIQEKVLTGGTAKGRLFRKYRMLEHTNIVTPERVKEIAQSHDLVVQEIRFDGLRPIFPRILYRLGFGGLFVRIERNLERGRRSVMSNMVIVLRRS